MDPLGADDPQVIGAYRLLGRLGSGGMGRVFVGRSAGGRTVAVKVVHAHFAMDEEFRARFRREVDAARRVGGAFTAPVLRRCAETVELGGTQIMFQGGHHPDYGVEYYEKHFSAIKKAFPQLVIHSLGASEVEHMARISGVSAEEAIRRIHAAGLDSFAGAGAELLPERPRKAIAPLKESGERWLEIMEIAHNLGVESTSTMLMGTGETNAERIEHIRMIRDVQDRTGGFRAFIPYTYQPENNHLKGQTQATVFEYLRMIAIARLFLDNVAHIQGSWLTVGKEAGQLALHYGADDLGSVMLEENVVSSAGARHRSNRMELLHLIRAAGRVPAQRATTYEHLVVHDDPANDPVDDHVVSHLSSTAIEGGTAHPELTVIQAS
ncbi:Cyclic dehypoxanthine futalosine synthase OS=Streptomyces antimycoticus OX=68175 GN=mqnC PE=3 SV=1 [Streptomyces antimycoticus]